jgi:hypothetical protein
MKMLSAAPSDHLTFQNNTLAMYTSDMRIDSQGGRAITRPQIELLAAKVSQRNACAY